uniref:Uncharacterized protein n=1 Tax=Eutreptiella gymnastica TaxID=73025 RepID=A0A7S1JIH1_9EUGL
MSVFTPFVDSSVLSCGAMQPIAESRPRGAPSGAAPPVPLFVPPAVPNFVPAATLLTPFGFAVPPVIEIENGRGGVQTIQVPVGFQVPTLTGLGWGASSFPAQQLANMQTLQAMSATSDVPTPDKVLYANQLEVELGTRGIEVPSGFMDVEQLEKSLGIVESKSKVTKAKKQKEGKAEKKAIEQPGTKSGQKEEGNQTQGKKKGQKKEKPAKEEKVKDQEVKSAKDVQGEEKPTKGQTKKSKKEGKPEDGKKVEANKDEGVKKEDKKKEDKKKEDKKEKKNSDTIAEGTEEKSKDKKRKPNKAVKAAMDTICARFRVLFKAPGTEAKIPADQLRLVVEKMEAYATIVEAHAKPGTFKALKGTDGNLATFIYLVKNKMPEFFIELEAPYNVMPKPQEEGREKKVTKKAAKKSASEAKTGDEAEKKEAAVEKETNGGSAPAETSGLSKAPESPGTEGTTDAEARSEKPAESAVPDSAACPADATKASTEKEDTNKGQ